MQKLFGKKIAIIGAGFTGISAAYKLIKSGAKVTIYENSNELGGLVSGCTILGVPIEKSPHVVLKDDHYLFNFLNELDLKDKLKFYKSSISTYYNNQLYPMTTPLDLLKFKPLKFHDRIRAGLSILYLQKIKNWKRLSSFTALKWLNKFAGKNVTKVIWEPLLKGKFGDYYDKVTMEFLWFRIKSRVDSRDKKLKGELLGYFDGGWKILISEIIDRLKLNGNISIKLSTPVDKVVYDKKTQNVNVISKEGVHNFDTVLLTVPSNIATKLLQDNEITNQNYFHKMKEIKYLDAAVMLFATDKPISKYFWHNINIENSPFVVLQTISNLIGSKKFGNKHVHYIVDYVPQGHQYMKCSEQELEEIWIKELIKLFPKFNANSIIEKKIFRLRNGQHVVDKNYQEKIPQYKTPIPGIFLSNFSQLYPTDRGVNYAIHEGFKVAELISKQSD